MIEQSIESGRKYIHANMNRRREKDNVTILALSGSAL